MSVHVEILSTSSLEQPISLVLTLSNVVTSPRLPLFFSNGFSRATACLQMYSVAVVEGGHSELKCEQLQGIPSVCQRMRTLAPTPKQLSQIKHHGNMLKLILRKVVKQPASRSAQSRAARML